MALLALAATIYAVLAMVGLSAILTEIGWVARVVQIAGGLYLVYLGATAWRSSVGAGTSGQQANGKQRKTFVSGLRLGALVNFSNPKAIAFFVGLYAVAVPPDATVETRIAILLGGAALELGWYGLLSSVLSQGAFRSAYEAGANWIERGIGSVLILFGARMIADK